MSQSDKPFPRSVSEDVNKQPLTIYDKVCFTRGNYIHKGTVAYFTTEGVTCQDETHRVLYNIQTSRQIVRI